VLDCSLAVQPTACPDCSHLNVQRTSLAANAGRRGPRTCAITSKQQTSGSSWNFDAQIIEARRPSREGVGHAVEVDGHVRASVHAVRLARPLLDCHADHLGHLETCLCVSFVYGISSALTWTTAAVPQTLRQLWSARRVRESRSSVIARIPPR
jgi:hypothetical protein